ncbi:MAG: 16S rRNA processing protein RimM, partial [Candidatus Zixiibacteriota bacterium]
HTLRVMVENVRPVKGCVIVQTKEITTIEDVQPWVHGDVEIDASERVTLPEGQYFLEDIIGLRVETASGDKIGTIVSILENAANDVNVCRNGEAEYLIPAVDEFIKQIDIPNGVMIIQQIAGMLE